jgi:hypothetical protein
MNERIRELAEQAGIAVWGDAVYMYHPKDTLDSTVLAKFTKLIVRECAGIVDNKIEVSRYVHEAELLRECSTTIKLHFGVEE